MAVRGFIDRTDGPTELIVGYYNESLTDALVAQKGFRPALVVDIDTDLYVSTRDALRWLLRHKLLVASPESGTLVRYDDWLMAANDVSWGQAKAHTELSAAYGLEWRRVGGTKTTPEFQLVGCSRC